MVVEMVGEGVWESVLVMYVGNVGGVLEKDGKLCKRKKFKGKGKNGSRKDVERMQKFHILHIETTRKVVRKSLEGMDCL